MSDGAAAESSAAGDDARVRRGIAVLQRFSQRKRGGLPMRFNPFGLFERKRVGIEELLVDDKDGEVVPAAAATPSAAGECATCGAAGTSSSASTTRVLFDVVVYTHVPTGMSLPPLMERSEVAEATTADLRGAEADAVDNTGAYHWAAEDILGHLLLTSPLFSLSRRGDGSPQLPSLPPPSPTTTAVLELGAGIGLAGFALAVSKRADTVIVTDGNRRVTSLLAANASRIAQHAAAPGGARAAEAMLLPWQIAGDAAMAADAVLERCAYVVGADCLFFEAFHLDLARLVLRYLGVRASRGADAMVVFVAPERGGSLRRFIDVLRSLDPHGREGADADCDIDTPPQPRRPLAITVSEDYDEGIFAVHRAHLAAAPANGYTADRHFPLLVTISLQP